MRRREQQRPQSRWRSLVVGAGLVGAFAVAPRYMPRPPLRGVQPPEAFALPESRWIDVGDGLRLHTVVLGQGEPTLVWLHGFSASVRLDAPFLRHLARFARVVAFDRPGFGLTPWSSHSWHGHDPCAPAVQPALTLALLDALGIERAVLIGHSAGGPIALATTQRDPRRARGLVLLAPAFQLLALPPVFRWLFAVPLVEWLGPLVLRLSPRLLKRSGALDRLWAQPMQASTHFLEETLRTFQVADWDVKLWQATRAAVCNPLLVVLSVPADVPVLALAGEADRVVPPALVADAARRIGPHVRFSSLHGCGHLLHLECPEMTSAQLQQFCAGLPA